MTTILLYLSFGAVFGVLSYRNRHLFGEGNPSSYSDPQGGLQGRLFWALVCTFLWPLMLVSGVHGLYRLAQNRRAQRDGTR